MAQNSTDKRNLCPFFLGCLYEDGTEIRTCKGERGLYVECENFREIYGSFLDRINPPESRVVWKPEHFKKTSKAGIKNVLCKIKIKLTFTTTYYILMQTSMLE